MSDKQEAEERTVERFFSSTYEYPGKMEVQIHSVYDPKTEKYMLIQYYICDDEENLKELTFAIDETYKYDCNIYKKMQENGYIDKNGNPTEKSKSREPTKSSLVDKINKIKTKDKSYEDCDC